MQWRKRKQSRPYAAQQRRQQKFVDAVAIAIICAIAILIMSAGGRYGI